MMGEICVGVFNPNMRAALYLQIKLLSIGSSSNHAIMDFVGKLVVEWRGTFPSLIIILCRSSFFNNHYLCNNFHQLKRSFLIQKFYFRATKSFRSKWKIPKMSLCASHRQGIWRISLVCFTSFESLRIKKDATLGDKTKIIHRQHVLLQ